MGAAREHSASGGFRLGIDIGGTFTDLVLAGGNGSERFLGKTLTTYPDPTEGILRGVWDLAQKHGVSLDQVKGIVHGTTLVTNTVIERKGAQTGLLATRHFEDVLAIGREMRYDIYDIFIRMPKPLIPDALRFGIEERTDAHGNSITPLNEEDVRRALRTMLRKKVTSVAICYLNAYANPTHEQQTAALIEREFPNLKYSLSSEVIPEIREFERTSATAMNAYVQPLVADYLQNLERRLAAEGYKGMLHIMDSAGRLTTAKGAARFPIQLLESGPAGGSMAGVFVGSATGQTNLVTFDMGGTTAKASLILEGQPEITHQFEAAREKRFKKGSGLPVRIPVMDMIEIGAGGGSIASLDSMGLLRVGPESAASNPGPACYGLGGTLPTVTDADLVLGYLNPDFFLGGSMPLHVHLAKAAISRHLAEPLGISPVEAAWGIHRMVNENMANAARAHILEKGYDPRFLTMMAFGGAGPVHAFHVARLLHSPSLIIPACAGVLSALGFLVSPVAKEEILSHVTLLDEINWPRVNALLQEKLDRAAHFLDQAGIAMGERVCRLSCDMRYRGQGHEIPVVLPAFPLEESHLEDIVRSFEEGYSKRYSRTIKGVPIETITWRLLLSGPPPSLMPTTELSNVGLHMQKGKRQIFLGRAFEEVPVYDRYGLAVGERLQGPCIVEESESTTVLGHNSWVTRDTQGNLIIEMSAA